MIRPRPRPQPPTHAIAPAEGHESRCLIFTGKDAARTLADPGEISELLKDKQNFVWFDIAEPTANDLATLQEEFSLHPMAIEDAALAHERPKIEPFDGFSLVILQPTTIDAETGEPVLHEIAILTGNNFLITIRATPVYPLDEIERRWLARGAIPHDPTGLLYVILDVVVDGYTPVASAFDARLDRLEEHVLDEKANPTPVLREVLLFKRELTHFRQAAAPVRDIVSVVLREDVAPLEASLKAYYRDVYDHAVRTVEQIDATRDLLNSTLDIHLSSQSQRQAEISKQLTTMATIFLPLTYITGFFGQNFGYMVGHIDKAGTFWWLGVGLQVVALATLFAYFRVKRWF